MPALYDLTHLPPSAPLWQQGLLSAAAALEIASFAFPAARLAVPLAERSIYHIGKAASRNTALLNRAQKTTSLALKKPFRQSGIHAGAAIGKDIVPKGGTSKLLPNGHIWQKASPFKNKTPLELHKMFIEKGYFPVGKDPLAGQGSYINPKNLRQYRIDPYNMGRYREPSHIDIGRPKDYTGHLGKKRFLYFDD
ncbi:MAG: hypothetical protein WAM28_01960, partial [Chlamydiales bacterium]